MNKKIFGYILFILSICMWLVPLFVSSLQLSSKEVVTFGTLAIIFGEIFFVLSVVILGKSFLNPMKYYIKKYWYKLLRIFRNQSIK